VAERSWRLFSVGRGPCQKGQVPAALSGQLSRARREQQIAVGGYIAGGALIATGIVLVIANRPHLLERAPGGGELAIVPAVSPDMVGLVVSVSR
jgi:hypothetical protein